MVAYKRKLNFFEFILLFVGIGVGIIGFLIISNHYQSNPSLTWDLFQTVFMWLLLIVVLILAATMEDVKEELAVIIKGHVEETKLLKEETVLLKEISHRQLEEIRLLREDLKKKSPTKRKK